MGCLDQPSIESPVPALIVPVQKVFQRFLRLKPGFEKSIQILARCVVQHFHGELVDIVGIDQGLKNSQLKRVVVRIVVLFTEQDIAGLQKGVPQFCIGHELSTPRVPDATDQFVICVKLRLPGERTA